MRNDARPIGENSPASPVGGGASPLGDRLPIAREQAPIESERPDSRDSVTHGRLSHTVHRQAEGHQPRGTDDPVTPSSDAAPNAKI